MRGKVAKATGAANAERTTLVLQGSSAILFGIAAVFWPGLTAEILVYLFAVFLLVDGIIAFFSGLVRPRYFRKTTLVLLLGVAQMTLGLYLVGNPQVTFASLILILGFTLILRGIFSFVHAFSKSKGPATLKTMHAILGALGVVLGIFIVVQPVAGGLAFVWVLGLYALISGPVMIAMSAELAKSK